MQKEQGKNGRGRRKGTGHYFYLCENKVIKSSQEKTLKEVKAHTKDNVIKVYPKKSDAKIKVRDITRTQADLIKE